MSSWRPRVTALVALPNLVLGAVAAQAITYGAVAVVADRRRRRHTIRREPDTRFAICIPAHNEERLIASTLASMTAQRYPRQLFSIHVVADNCTDDTVRLARHGGAEVHERDAPGDGGKGKALMWLMGELDAQDDPADAIVIVDADTTLEPDFLTAMDRALQSGAVALQGYYGARDPESSPTVAIRYAALAIRHYLRPLARTTLGGSSGLYGNGMVFRRELFNQHGFSSHLTEDLELQIDLMLHGHLVGFVPDAHLVAEMPTTLAASASQHERWERGRQDLAGRFVGKLLRSKATSTFARVDTAVDQLLPPLSITVVATGAAAGIAQVWSWLNPAAPTRAIAKIGRANVISLVAYVVIGLRLAKAPRSVWRSLTGAPRLIWWKLGLWRRVMRTPDEVTWVRTARNDEQGEP